MLICCVALLHTKITSSTVREQKEVALLGQELMLCRAGDLDLIRVRGSTKLLSVLSVYR